MAASQKFQLNLPTADLRDVDFKLMRETHEALQQFVRDRGIVEE